MAEIIKRIQRSVAEQRAEKLVITDSSTYRVGNKVYERVSRAIDRVLGAFDRLPSSPEEKARWDAARDAGIELHGIAHTFMETGKLPEEGRPDIDICIQQIKAWVEKLRSDGFEYVCGEYWLYNDDGSIAGTIDCLFYHANDNRFILVDWKRIAVLYDHHIARYQLQLSIYRFLLQKTYPDMRLDDIILVQAHPTLESPIETSIFILPEGYLRECGALRSS
jgi:hypothetical protein